MKKVMTMLVLFLFVFSIVPVQARAGGGGSGGSSGSGGGGSRAPHSTSRSRRLAPILPGSGLVVGALLFGFGRYVRRRKIIHMHQSIKEQLEESYQNDDFWNESELKDKVKESYYIIQKAWSDQDLDTLKKYLSDHLYQQWEVKINWQDFRKERNVLDHIYLISKTIVSTYDDQDDSQDCFWVAIEGKMNDQTIVDHEVIRQTNAVFIEYWKFIRCQERILLDEIRQENEI